MIFFSTIHAKLLTPYESQDSNLSPVVKIGLTLFAQLSAQDRATARLVCRQWQQVVDKMHRIENYCQRLMASAEIRCEAAHVLSHIGHLSQEQHLLFNIVKASTNCQQVQVAAANALMILKKTNFCFNGADFNNIQVPGVRLPRAILDKTNFAGANLEGADLTDCSLESACFDRADLKNVEFGHLPYLEHGVKVSTMALSPNGKWVASVTSNYLYVWNLDTMKASKHECRRYYVPSFLSFSQDSQWLFTASNKALEVWKTNSLEKVEECMQAFQSNAFISFLALTADGKHMVSATGKWFGHKTKIRIWQVILLSTESLKLQLIKTLKIACPEMKFALQGSQLAIANFDQQTIQLYSIPSLEILHTIDLSLAKKAEGDFIDLLFVPQSNSLLFAKRFSHKTSVYLWNAKQAQVTELFTEEGNINNLSFISDSQRLAYCLGLSTLCIRQGNKSFALEVREDMPYCDYDGKRPTKLCFSHQYLYAIDEEKILRMPLEKFALRKKKDLHRKMQAVYFSLYEQTFRMIDDVGKLHTYSLEGKPHFTNRALALLRQFNASPISSAAQWPLSNDGPKVHGRMATKAKLHLASNSRYVLVSVQNKFRENKSPYRKVTKIVSLHLFKDWQERFKLNHINILAYDLSADGRYLVTAHQQGLEIWSTSLNTKQGSILLEVGEQFIHRLCVSTMAFPHALLVLVTEVKGYTQSNSTEGNVTKILEIDWEKQLVKEIRKFFNIGYTHFIAASSLILCHRDQIMQWQRQSNKTEVIKRYETKDIISIGVSEDGALMVVTESFMPKQFTLSLWDIRQKKKLDEKFCRVSDNRFKKLIAVISSKNQCVICWVPTQPLNKLYVWQIRKGKLHALCKIPKQLEVKGLSIKNAQNLSEKNALLLTQLQSK